MTKPSLSALLGATMLAGLPTTLAAQDAAPAAATGLAADIDEIVVTGSRIARTELESPQPIQAVSEADILLSGDVNVVDIVNDLPALIGSATGPESTAAGNLGTATLDLRNLGAERTLVLVDGRRHVAGLAGTGAVDVNTIPAALVERVEVLTGGASAVYGADAVTGVVNFILRDDFEGIDARGQVSLTGEGDGFAGYASVTGGTNFADGRGNVALNLTYERQEAFQFGDRDWARGDREGTDWPNPDRFIQAADIAALGLDPVTLGDGLVNADGDCIATGAATALCDRAVGSPGRAILPFPRFNLSSYGSLIGVDFFGDGFLTFYPGNPTEDNFDIEGDGDFTYNTIRDLTNADLGADGVIFDLNGNGVEDCLETINATQLQRFSGFAGCHVTRTPGGPADVFADGLIAGNANAFGGDGTGAGRDDRDLVPQDDRFVASLQGRYDVTEGMRAFFEGKYAYSKTEVNTAETVAGFFDSLGVGLDNPFIPANLRGAIETFVDDNDDTFDRDDVLVFVGRDITDFGDRGTESERQTMRFVGGIEGDLGASSFSYELSANYGRTEADSTTRGDILVDRFYAASDATTDEAGDPVCRSSLDGNPEPFGSFLPSGGPFRGFLTFDPNDGSCVPLDLFGIGAPSQAAIDFVTTDTERSRTIQQTVLSGFVAGDTSDLFDWGPGDIGLVVGAEYRKEESDFTADPLEQPREDPIGAVDAFQPIFPVDGPTADVSGAFDVWEVFGEVSVPLLADVPVADLLRFDAAYRYSEYDTLGGADTYNLALIYAPNPSVRFRGSLSQTVRAPNVNELFSPLQSTTARPIDPCDASQLDRGTNPANRRANCAADGLPDDFEDPLTARVGGFVGGNPDLDAETADTLTLGTVVTPSVAPGLSVTLDYYEIEIEDAIQSVGLQEALNACYDGALGLESPFCDAFTRDRRDGSGTFLGVSSFTVTESNFVAVKTKGFDLQADYGFDLGVLTPDLDRAGRLDLRVVANRVLELERAEDPADPDNINDQLFEQGQPRLAVNTDARWTLGDLTVNWQARYLGQFLEITPRLQIEDAADTANAFTGDLWRHDVSATYALSDDLTLYGGVNNVADQEPILTSSTYPFGPQGRQFFFGANARF